VAVTHRYESSGGHVIKLIISGQLTLRGPIQLAEVAVNVVVRDRPSLGDVMGHVTLASQSQPAYVNKSVKFVYAVERVVQNVSYQVLFSDGRETTVREHTSLLEIVNLCPPAVLHFSDRLSCSVGTTLETKMQRKREIRH